MRRSCTRGKAGHASYQQREYDTAQDMPQSLAGWGRCHGFSAVGLVGVNA